MTLNTYDDLAICNLAMDAIGAKPINSILAPANDREATTARLYKVTMAGLLARNAWNFADGYLQLAVAPDVQPVGGYQYAFKLPSAAIAGPFAIYDGGNLKRPVHDYINSGDHIHTDRQNLWALYRKSVPVGLWPMYFIELAYTALGSVLAKPIMSNMELATELRIRAYGSANEGGQGGLFATAKSLDALAQPMRSLFENGDPLTSLMR